jgi:hypothetical protein
MLNTMTLVKMESNVIKKLLFLVISKIAKTARMSIEDFIK